MQLALRVPADRDIQSTKRPLAVLHLEDNELCRVIRRKQPAVLFDIVARVRECNLIGTPLKDDTDDWEWLWSSGPKAVPILDNHWQDARVLWRRRLQRIISKDASAGASIG